MDDHASRCAEDWSVISNYTILVVYEVVKLEADEISMFMQTQMLAQKFYCPLASGYPLYEVVIEAGRVFAAFEPSFVSQDA